MTAEHIPVLEEHSSHSLLSSCTVNLTGGQLAGTFTGSCNLYLKAVNAENRMAFQDSVPDIMSELAVNKRQDENQ